MNKFFVLVLIFLVSYTSLSQENFPVNGVKLTNQESYAFVNADIYLSFNEKIEGATLIIKDDIIIDVGKNIKIPKESIIYDLSNLTICPSFIDIFSEYGQNKNNKNTQTLGSWNSALNTEYNAVSNFFVNEKESRNYINHGFGLVNSLKRDGIIRGTSVLVSLNSRSTNNLVELENSALCMSFDKGSSSTPYPNSLMGSIALIRQSYYDMFWYENNKTDFNNSLASFVNNKRLPKIFEVDGLQSIFRANKIQKEFEDNFIIKTKGDEYQRVEELKTINPKLIVPLNFPEINLPNDPYDHLELSLKELKSWEMAPYNLKILFENNIDFALTTHGEELKDFFKNLNKSISLGFSESGALKALTYNPAKFLNIYNKVGSISKGKKANFLIFSGNLFSEEFIIVQNWIDGVSHDVNNKNITKLIGEHSLFVDEKEEGLINFFVEKGKIAGDFSSGELKKKKLRNIKLIGNRISFSYNKNFFSGVFDNDITGELQDSLLDWKKFNLVKNNFYPIKKNDLTNIPKHGDILFPNSAYGLIKEPIQETILFKNATVWTNESRGIIKNCDVAIENGKIIAVGRNIKKTVFRNSKNLQIIDASGKHITSGIIDEHSHIAISGGVNESTQAVTSEVRIGDVINANDINIYRQLSGGVTVAQLLHGSANPIGGQSSIIKLRWGKSAENLKFKKAKPFIKFALGENVKQSNWGNNHKTRFPQTRMGVEQIMIDAFSRAKDYEYNLKNYKRNKKPKPRRDLELDAILEIINKERYITCHSYIQSEIIMLMNLAKYFNFNINTFTHVLEGYKIADKLKEHGANASTFSDWWAYKYEVNDAIPHNASILNQMGVNTAINSDDAEMGRRLNQEAAKMVKYGNTSQEDAWKMITLNPAKMLHIDTYVGSIRKNKHADIVLWSDNPLSIYSYVEKTFIDGRCYFSTENDLLHRSYIKKEKSRLLNKLINHE